ncbi:spermine oxidase-like [Formica exsecta]|uniref:spermine oxidase-like n=1 Tax=Formica exsecta TaxID=72781 RepID=UPI001141A99A|nr:spermine oxidase-like [Formica exsecta]XP_029660904.1 spermine oxidase-like [Formica exsecta]XP_029660905.1 spermine oxidase-like [Formica exsecta]XP_029660906.1 spermine oxidase-like [Formica exsecta]
MSKKTKTIIVGAGAAGIAAASKLLQQGMDDFVILEANNRIGGRIHTVNFGENVVDLGAQWVHGESGNIVFELASKHNLLGSFSNLFDPTKHNFAASNGEMIPKDESSEAMMIFFDIINNAQEKLKEETGSFGNYFIKEYYKIFNEKPFASPVRAAEYLSWMEKMENSIECSDTWFDTSAKRLTEYWECEGNSVLNWKDRGYKTLFDLLLKKIPDRFQPEEYLPVMEKIEFEKVVTTINYSSGEDVTVTTRDGCEYFASHVIFTGSLGVLKEKHSTMFVPPLPQKKQRAITGLNIGTTNKVFLEFPYRWWPEDMASFDIIWPEEDKKEFLETCGQSSEWLCDVFSFLTVVYQPNILCAWIVGKNARYMETLSDVDVFDGLYLLLKRSLGKYYDVVKPTKILRSKWYSDEHFHGSYTFQSTISEQMDVRPKDLAEPIMMDGNKPVILFAGEATHDHYYSTVHGAVGTGFREADRLIAYERTRNDLDQLVNNFNEAVQIDADARKTERTRVVIVGAGIAGLAAAKTLEDAKFTDYLLLEAQDVVGGRIHSVSWNNDWIDCGAQFLHGDKSKLAQYCLDNNLLSNIQGTDGEGIFLRDDGTIMNENLIHEIDDLLRTVSDDICESRWPLKKYETIGSIMRCRFEEYLRERNDSLTRKKMEEIFDWNVRFLLVDNCCHSLDDLSASLWGKFKYVGGPEHLLFKSGYSSLTKLLIENLSEEKVRLATPVETISWRDSVESRKDSLVIVTTSKGTQIIADAVIVTCSLGYLKENYRNMFQPPLPNRLSVAIEDLGFGTINKIFLDFGEPWWQTDVKGFQLLWHRDDHRSLPEWTKDITGFDVLPNHPATFVVWVGGRGARIVEDLSEWIIAQDCTNLLMHYLRCHDIPPVKKCVRTKWHGNKYMRGGYSHITKNCEDDDVLPRTLAEPVWATILHNNTKKNLPVILFAGEATHDDFYSTTHGAYETGIHQAKIFLQHHASIN